ncbi:MAG: hypothetical protein ACRDK2_12445 [Solirubrobacteraceae bacterium]
MNIPSVPRMLVICAGPFSECLATITMRTVQPRRALAPPQITLAGASPSSGNHGLPISSHELFAPRRGELLRSGLFGIVRSTPARLGISPLPLV